MPRIQTTPTVKAALLGLQIYVILLLVLIVIGFVRKVCKNGNAQPQVPAAPAARPGQ